MARIKLDLPSSFNFSCILPIRITDLNYGGHVGNDTILSLLHEARVRFLKNLGYGELDFGGASLIMGDVSIEYKNELFYGEDLTAWVTVSDVSKVSFDIYYKLEKQTTDKIIQVAVAKTGMVCFDYKNRKVTAIPDAVKQRLTEIM